MGSWQVEKKNYLSQDIDTKRKNYGTFIEIKDVRTWKQFAEESNLPPKSNILPGNTIDESKNKILAEKVSVFAGDITKLEIDAIVNAANSTLLGGGGVDGCIHRAAGGFLKQECSTLGGCDTGEAKITGGYKLPSKYVIHTVGPMGEKPEFLANCYKNSLKVMLENNLKTIAFPCISTGIYGYPNLPAAHVAIYTVRKELEKNADKIDRVIFCLFLKDDIDIYEKLLQSYFPTE